MAEKLFYSMGEVAELFDVNQSLLRHWESQFPILHPKRNKKGNRLFSPRDIETLKLIYHLVKERGMTLEGAKKALGRRPQAAGSGVERDVELMERLQRIRAMLVEVREDLKEGPAAGTAAAAAADAVRPAVSGQPGKRPDPSGGAESASEGLSGDASGDAFGDASGATDAGSPETPVPSGTPVPPVRRGRKAVVRIVEGEAPADPAAPADPSASAAPKPAARRGRRRKEDDADKELFAFYEQSLF